MDDRFSIEALEAESMRLVLPRFDHGDAWRLGTTIAAHALEAGATVAIDIRRPGLILFRAALPGSGPDQEDWIRRKSATTLRLETSTLLLRERFASLAIDPTRGWLPSEEYVLAGGAMPVRVAGVGVVAVATASGLTDEEDHALIADGISALLTEMTKA